MFLYRTIAALWASAVFVRAQDLSPAKVLAAYPSCSLPCILNAFNDGLCSLTNQTCICTDAQFKEAVTVCVTASCTIPESLVVLNMSMTNCNAPIRDRADNYTVIFSVMTALAALFVAIRFAVKIFIVHVDLGMDDWFILATLMTKIPGSIILVNAAIDNGLGKDVWTLTPSQITNFVFYFYIMVIIYFLQTSLLKLSIISFYLRVFSGDVKRLLWGSFIFTALWGISFIIATILQCHPVSLFWTKWDGLHEGTCANSQATGWANASINIALDLWMLAIPLWQVKKLHLHWKKKIGVAIMFCVGTFVTVISMLRLHALVDFETTKNATWQCYDVVTWSTIEMCVGIMCACLPAVRLLLVKVFPALGGSSHSNGNNTYNPSGAPHSAVLGATSTRQNDKHGTIGIVTAKRSSLDPEAVIRGIAFRTTYEVQFSNEDEARLVQMDEFDPKRGAKK